MDFEKILRRYQEGGTDDIPVTRTMGTIVDYLLNKKQYPLDVIGGAVFLVFNWLAAGNKFKGDGTYGSPGRELVTALRIKCDDLLKMKLESETYKVFVEFYADALFKTISDGLDVGSVEKCRRRFVNWWQGRKVYYFTS